MSNNNSFSTRLTFALQARNMKQIDLADLTNISSAQINEYIKGKCKPKQDKLNLIASVLDINPAWLSGFDVPMENNPSELEKFKNDLKDIRFAFYNAVENFTLDDMEDLKLAIDLINAKKEKRK